MPELISGSALAVASTVAPKMTPFTPARSASTLPLTSSTTPASSVTAQPAPNRLATLSVDEPANGCGCSGWGWRRCLRPGWLPGMDTLQRGSLRTLLIT